MQQKRFQVFDRHLKRGHRWFWRLRGANNRIICSGQAVGFHNKADALSAIELVKGLEPETPVEVIES